MTPTPDTTARTETAGETYLIRKGGAYYRPNAQGYTRHVSEAGRFTLEEAIAYSHPNGPNGPRDGIDYVPAPAETAGKTPEALTFTYTNWRGETTLRRVRAHTATFRFDTTEWHPEPQWLMAAVDADKMEWRSFAVKDIVFAASPTHLVEPVARVIDDNGPHNTATIRMVCDPPTLEVGTLLYGQSASGSDQRLSRALCSAIHALSLAVHDEGKRNPSFYDGVFAEAEAALASPQHPVGVREALEHELGIPAPADYEAAVRERNAWIDSAMTFSQGESFYRGIVRQIGDMFGEAARTSDDGSVQDSVLALKVPELVRAALADPSSPVTDAGMREVDRSAMELASTMRSSEEEPGWKWWAAYCANDPEAVEMARAYHGALSSEVHPEQGVEAVATVVSIGGNDRTATVKIAWRLNGHLPEGLNVGSQLFLAPAKAPEGEPVAWQCRYKEWAGEADGRSKWSEWLPGRSDAYGHPRYAEWEERPLFAALAPSEKHEEAGRG